MNQQAMNYQHSYGNQGPPSAPPYSGYGGSPSDPYAASGYPPSHPGYNAAPPPAFAVGHQASGSNYPPAGQAGAPHSFAVGHHASASNRPPAGQAGGGNMDKLNGILDRFEISIAEANDLVVLQDYEIVIICDDSGSMSGAAQP